jgi:hypothetical protein
MHLLLDSQRLGRSSQMHDAVRYERRKPLRIHMPREATASYPNGSNISIRMHNAMRRQHDRIT